MRWYLYTCACNVLCECMHYVLACFLLSSYVCMYRRMASIHVHSIWMIVTVLINMYVRMCAEQWRNMNVEHKSYLLLQSWAGGWLASKRILPADGGPLLLRSRPLALCTPYELVSTGDYLPAWCRQGRSNGWCFRLPASRRCVECSVGRSIRRANLHPVWKVKGWSRLVDPISGTGCVLGAFVPFVPAG